FGQAADMDPILEIARRHGLPVIEDACQAHGAEYKGRKAGSLGICGCFSFYPGKNLGAFGEAGAVVTNSEELKNKIQMLRDDGQAGNRVRDPLSRSGASSGGIPLPGIHQRVVSSCGTLRGGISVSAHVSRVDSGTDWICRGRVEDPVALLQKDHL